MNVAIGPISKESISHTHSFSPLLCAKPALSKAKVPNPKRYSPDSIQYLHVETQINLLQKKRKCSHQAYGFRLYRYSSSILKN